MIRSRNAESDFICSCGIGVKPVYYPLCAIKMVAVNICAHLHYLILLEFEIRSSVRPSLYMRDWERFNLWPFGWLSRQTYFWNHLPCYRPSRHDVADQIPIIFHFPPTSHRGLHFAWVADAAAKERTLWIFWNDVHIPSKRERATLTTNGPLACSHSASTVG